MSQALQLAGRGLYSTHPNPRVGCVLVKSGNIVGRGWHEYAGGPHAEINAIADAGKDANGADCYVTLEPCVHTGKTPPCTDALIKAGIKKVIVAATDPNPKVSGKGIEHLRQNGIAVESGLLESAARKLNPGFEMRMRENRPYVRCKLAMSTDGRTAMANGQSQWITGDAARMDGQRLRARSSVVLTGINTVLNDDPSMNVRDIETIRQPLRVILDRKLRIERHAKILNLPGESIIFTVYGCPGKEKKLVADNIPVVRIDGSGEKDFLVNLMHYLAREKEANEILVESGPTLAGSLLQAGLIDEFVIYMAPILLGSNARPLLNLPGLENMADRIELEFSDVRMLGNDLRLLINVKK